MGKRKSKRGKSALKARSGNPDVEPEDLAKAPHSFVINRGRLGKNGNDLMLNFRKLMEPFTASHLRVQRQNVLKDFVHMAGPLNVTHLVVFTKTEIGMYMRIGKLPRGPTLTYQIKEYCLMRDIVSSQKKSLMYEKLFDHHPLLVLNNFSGEGMHFKLMATMFQNMLPSINVNKTNLNTIRRCLLLHYNNDKTIDMRQYAIKIVPAGVSKAVKKLIQSKVPNLSQYQNIDEFLQSGNVSESEAELDCPANTVVLPQPISSRGNIASEKSAIRLYEMGPRLKLQLIKIEEGVMTGEVLYHEFIKRTPEEIKALKKRIKAQKLLKDKRRAEQKRNVEKKMAKKKGESVVENEQNIEDDDRQYYRDEVGEEPDENMPGFSKKRKSENVKLSKKRKTDASEISNASEKGSSEKLKNTESIQDFLKRRKKRKETLAVKKRNKKISQTKYSSLKRTVSSKKTLKKKGSK